MARLVYLEILDFQVEMEFRVMLALLETREVMETQDSLDNLEKEDRRESQEILAQLEIKENRERRVFVGCQGAQERMVGMEIQVPLVLLAPLDLVVLTETEEREELRVPKVLREKLVPRACLETQAATELLEIKGHLAWGGRQDP